MKNMKKIDKNLAQKFSDEAHNNMTGLPDNQTVGGVTYSLKKEKLSFSLLSAWEPWILTLSWKKAEINPDGSAETPVFSNNETFVSTPGYGHVVAMLSDAEREFIKKEENCQELR